MQAGLERRLSACRNKRARERYWSSPAILDLQRARARRNANHRRVRQLGHKFMHELTDAENEAATELLIERAV